MHPGLHITGMGSDMEGKQEIDPAALGDAALYAVDRLSQCALLGELRGARDAGLLPEDLLSLARSSPARSKDDCRRMISPSPI
jgi:ornithine cyclodeaminase/alanine dehydrogenase-like protein (mu-crystallin family)